MPDSYWLAALAVVLFGCSSAGPSPSPLVGEDAGAAGQTDIASSGGAKAFGGATSSNSAGDNSGTIEAGAPNDGSCRIVGQTRCSDAGERQVCRDGGWSTVEDCGGAGRCNTARDNCLACAPGALHCRGQVLEQCSLDGDSYETVRTCSDTCVSDGDRAYCQLCKAGEVTCDTTARAVPSTEATSADRTSVESRVLRCNSEGSGEDLVEACGGDTSVCDATSGACRACLPLELRCDGSQLMRCNKRGSGFDLVQDCGDAHCDASAGRCADVSCSKPDGTFAVNDVACEGNGSSSLAICRDNGSWEVLDLCDDAAGCAAGIASRRCLDVADNYCQPGSSRCLGNTLERCAGDAEAVTTGSYYQYAECAYGCEQGEDGSAQCTTGATGSAYVQASVCDPGSAQYLACDGSSCSMSSCAPGQVCKGSGAGCGPCVPGAFRCDGSRLLQCNAAGSKEELSATCTGACDAFRGTCLPAKVGERYCDGKDFRMVMVDGSSRTVESCSAAELCDPRTGCREGSCAVGSVSCVGDNGLQPATCDDGTGFKVAAKSCAAHCEPGLGCAEPRRIAAGDAHTCVLLAAAGSADSVAGYVRCWGANEAGQTGDGSALFADHAEATAVRSQLGAATTSRVAPLFLASGLCAGKNFTCADIVLPTGSVGVGCWGANDRGQLGFGQKLAADDAMPSANGYNQLYQPVARATDNANGYGSAAASGLHAVSCGADFACALDEQNQVYCWGANDFGQLGTGPMGVNSSASALPVSGLKGVKQLVLGGHHACAIGADDTIYCWGDGSKGQLGIRLVDTKGSVTPASVPNVSGDWLALGRDFTLVAKQAPAALSGFGENWFGQLGTGAALAVDGVAQARSLQVSAIRNVISGSGAAHVCLTDGDGALWCWGANPLGQLGDGTQQDEYQPVAISVADKWSVAMGAGQVAIGKGHTCALDTAGALRCWGANRRHQLGSRIDADLQATPALAF